MIGHMDPGTSSVAFQNVPTAPPPAYSASNTRVTPDVNPKFHVTHPALGSEIAHNLADLRHSHGHMPIQDHPQYGQLMDDLRSRHSNQLATNSHSHADKPTVPKEQNNNNNNVVVVPAVQQPAVIAPHGGPSNPHITAININGGGAAGPRRYRREANHLVHFLLSIVFPPWIFVWCVICCCYGCPNICCCCGDGDSCENCCPKHYEEASATRSRTSSRQCVSCFVVFRGNNQFLSSQPRPTSFLCPRFGSWHGHRFLLRLLLHRRLPPV